MAGWFENRLIAEVERLTDALQEEQAESLRQAEIAREALEAEVERPTSHVKGRERARAAELTRERALRREAIRDNRDKTEAVRELQAQVEHWRRITSDDGK